MRLFVAVELDEAARTRIADEQRRLRSAVAGMGDLRWVQTSQMHLTLVFLGEVDEQTASRAVDAMNPPVPLAPFRLTFGGAGVFPPRGAPRVLWLGVTKGGEAAAALHAIVAERIVRCGVALEERVFRPHLTLARWRDGRMRRSAKRLANARDLARRTVAEIDVRKATLFRSQLSSSAPVYMPLAQAALVPPPPLQ